MKKVITIVLVMILFAFVFGSFTHVLAEVDKTQLVAAIELAKQKDQSMYSPKSWAVFKKALTAAEANNISLDSTQANIDYATNRLLEVMDELVLLGDANIDGDITSADALLVLQHETDRITLNEDELSAADVNRDEKVSSSDALLIIKFVSDRIDKF